jgi:hypothetical protein
VSDWEAMQITAILTIDDSKRRALRSLQVIAQLSAPSRVSVNATSRRKRPAMRLRPHPGVGVLTTIAKI